MEKEVNQKKEVYEIKAKLNIVSGLQFGFGLGIGFFLSGLLITFILFSIFSVSIAAFIKSVSDPLGIKEGSYQTTSVGNKVSNPLDIQKFVEELKR